MESRSSQLRVDIVRPLVLYWKFIALAVIAASLAITVVRVSGPTTYEANIVLVPTRGTDDASARLGQLSGLANLAGISVNQRDAVSNFDRFMYLIGSEDLAGWQIKHRNILPLLFETRWDAEHRAWKPPSGILSPLSAFYHSLMGEPAWQPPSAADVVGIYQAKLVVSKVPSATSVGGDTGMVKLTYSDPDAQRAQQILDFIITDANEMLREKAAERAAVQAEYLREKLASVEVQEYKDTLDKLLSQQEQTLMLTHSRLPFAAEPVSEQDVPPQLVGKRALTYGFIAAILAFCFAYFVALLVFNLGLVNRKPKRSAVDRDAPRLAEQQT